MTASVTWVGAFLLGGARFAGARTPFQGVRNTMAKGDARSACVPVPPVSPTAPAGKGPCGVQSPLGDERSSGM